MLQNTRTNLILGCFFFLALGSLGIAQGMMGGYGGGMGGYNYGGNPGYSSGTGSYNSTFAGMGNGSMTGDFGNMSGYGMGGGTDMSGSALGMSGGAVTVGNDGNLYVLSRVLPSSSGSVSTSAQIQTELTAIGGQKGTVLWTYTFDETWLTRPVQGPDGHLFLLAFGNQVMGVLNSTSAQDQNARLYIVDPSQGKLLQTVALSGQVASLPLISVTGDTYVVLVESFDIEPNTSSTSQRREPVLTAFNPDGTEAYTISLNQ